MIQTDASSIFMLFQLQEAQAERQQQQQQQDKFTSKKQSSWILRKIVTMVRALFVFALIIAAASAFVSPVSNAGESTSWIGDGRSNGFGYGYSLYDGGWHRSADQDTISNLRGDLSCHLWRVVLKCNCLLWLLVLELASFLDYSISYFSLSALTCLSIPLLLLYSFFPSIHPN